MLSGNTQTLSHTNFNNHKIKSRDHFTLPEQQPDKRRDLMEMKL